MKKRKLSSEICMLKEFELEYALELYSVLHASCSLVKCKEKIDLFKLTQNFYLVASIAVSNLLNCI